MVCIPATDVQGQVGCAGAGGIWWGSRSPQGSSKAGGMVSCQFVCVCVCVCVVGAPLYARLSAGGFHSIISYNLSNSLETLTL